MSVAKFEKRDKNNMAKMSNKSGKFSNRSKWAAN